MEETPRQKKDGRGCVAVSLCDIYWFHCPPQGVFSTAPSSKAPGLAPRQHHYSKDWTIDISGVLLGMIHISFKYFALSSHRIKCIIIVVTIIYAYSQMT